MGKLFTEQFAFSQGDSVVVIGLGRFGGAVAKSLMSLGHDVMGIDRDAEPVQAWADRLTHAVQADATQVMVMRQLGVADFRHAIVGIGDNLAASLMTLMALTELGVADIWVKALTEEHGKIAQRMGAHHVVYPEADMMNTQVRCSAHAGLRVRAARLVNFEFELGIALPLMNGSFGLAIGVMLGLDAGTVAAFAMLAASASYIAVPAAMRMALPKADPGIYLSMSLAVTFPFNIVVGIPLFAALAARFAG